MVKKRKVVMSTTMSRVIAYRGSLSHPGLRMNGHFQLGEGSAPPMPHSPESLKCSRLNYLRVRAAVVTSYWHQKTGRLTLVQYSHPKMDPQTTVPSSPQNHAPTLERFTSQPFQSHRSKKAGLECRRMCCSHLQLRCSAAYRLRDCMSLGATVLKVGPSSCVPEETER
jgi:hypothetical protein